MLSGFNKVSLLYKGNKTGDIHMDRAAIHAFGLFAVEATAGLKHSKFRCIPVGHFIEIPRPVLWCLLGHGLSRRTFFLRLGF